MSGHSHARTVKHQKQMDAKKRSKVFSKMVRLISVTVRKGGANPELNPKLRMAIEKARSYNMPKENIQRAIKRASGKLETGELEEFIFEAYGPGKTALLIEGITDNKNRSLNEIKNILNRHQGKLVQKGAVSWMFSRKGCITLERLEKQKEGFQNKEKAELAAIDAGAEDVLWRDEALDVYTEIKDLEKTKKDLEEGGIKIASSNPEWKPQKEIEVDEKDKEACLRLFEALDEHDDVQDIYSNLKL